MFLLEIHAIVAVTANARTSRLGRFCENENVAGIFRNFHYVIHERKNQ